jgi:hypothetical protein
MPLIHRILVLVTSSGLCTLPLPALPLLQANVAATENFDALAASGTSAALPPGWSLLESGSGANATYGAGTGSSTTGNTYSFGASGSGERALGGLRSAGVVPMFGTVVTNQTGVVLVGLAVAYTGEQWRLGATGRADRLDFSYSLDATSLSTGTWIDVDALDFVAPVSSGSAGALNGNLAAHRVDLAGSILGLNLAPGAELMLRWTDFDAAGADDGLAIDDLAVTGLPAAGAPVPDHLPPGATALALGLLGIVVARCARPGA